MPTLPPSSSVFRRLRYGNSRVTVETCLTRDMRPNQRTLNRKLVEQLAGDFRHWCDEQHDDLNRRAKAVRPSKRAKWRSEQPLAGIKDSDQRTIVDLTTYLRRRVDIWLERLATVDQLETDFRTGLSVALDTAATEQLILDTAMRLGASSSELRADTKALNRWLNEEAIFDRIARQRGVVQHELTFALDRLGVIYGQQASQPDSKGQKADSQTQQWRRFEFERLLRDVLTYPCDARVYTAVTRCLRRSLFNIPPATRTHLFTDQTLAVLIRAASDPTQDVWLQCEALHTLATAGATEWLKIARRRLLQPAGGDDMFVRRYTIRLMENVSGAAVATCASEVGQSDDGLAGVIDSLIDDPSDFVRQQLAHSLWRVPQDWAYDRLRSLLRDDPSPKVRAAAIVSGISTAGAVAADFSGAGASTGLSKHDFWIEQAQHALRHESDPFVMRTAITASVAWLDIAIQSVDGAKERYQREIVPALEALRQSAESVPVRRWAAAACERIWLRCDPAAAALSEKFRKVIGRIQPGHSKPIPRSWLADPDGKMNRPTHDALVGRVLAVLAQEDFGLEIERTVFGPRLVRGTVMATRMWRILHELRHSATDKRQGVRHTIGRISYARIRAPSGILAEMSATKVPGEPLFIAEDGSWRPYIPLLDDFVSALAVSRFGQRRVRFFTAAGVTQVKPPTGIVRRMRALAKLTWNFASLAELRNWTSDAGHEPSAYVDALRAMGFEIEFAEHDDPDLCHSIRPSAEQPAGPRGSAFAGHDSNSSRVNDKSVSQFFSSSPAFIPFDSVAPLWDAFLDYADYFTSTLDNTFQQMLIFTIGFLFLFLLKHWWSNWRMGKARQRVAISLGGWGTRGKSGTERLKAALVSAMGHSLVSKTTGCEAMFIQSEPFGEQLEIPLYRPGDKATIWEHANVIRMAGRMNASVFLWECMALSPSYVDVLQRQWSCDELSTITNAYPDHEDIQGPAGFNVAQTISGFVPRKSNVVSSEGQMRPILENACNSQRTSMRSVGWLESGLVTQDILERFPYMEHPDNIALVAAMADELGVDYDFALKAMADGLVPDLGVLKSYPVADISGRQIEFINGMSANERFGCLGNWSRMGFADHDPNAEPGVWLTTVVNNRADRVARSKVFANIIVEDVSADRHFLIGTNLDGMQGYIQAALDARLDAMSFPEDVKAAREQLLQHAKVYRQHVSKPQILDRLRVMLESVAPGISEAGKTDVGRPASGTTTRLSAVQIEQIQSQWSEPQAITAALVELGVDPTIASDIEQHHTSALDNLQEFESLQSRLVSEWASSPDGIRDQWRSMLRKWFNAKLVAIENSEATGEQIIRTIVNRTPPGIRNRVMGVQNIKGTGMDFIYRFQYWEECFRACRMLESRDPQTIQKALDALQSLPLGQLCFAEVMQSIGHARRQPSLQAPEFQAAMDNISARVVDAKESIVDMSAAMAQGHDRRQSGWWDRCVHGLEQFLDVNDSARRRNKADQIYRDLAVHRIGKKHAVSELRKINRRQKGGWLPDSLRGRADQRKTST